MNHKFEKDYKEFTSSEGISPSPELDHKILNYVKNELNPSHATVFAKLLAIQGFIGLVTMLFCPQFSLSLTNNHDAFHYFHHTFGENICMAICGSIFVGAGAIFAAYLLKAGEVRKIYNSSFLYYTFLSLTMLLPFILLGADIFINLTLFWFIGATCSGALLFLLNYKIRLLGMRPNQ